MSRKVIVSACVVAMFASMAMMTARAQTADDQTYFAFKGPVELPGVTLPPGRYLFRFADFTTSRKVIQVVSGDSSKKTYGLFITITAQRPTPANEAEVRFMETPAGAPPAIKTWWYPGNSIGREFIYPRDQAIRLARASNEPVLTTKDASASSEQMKTAELSRVSPSGQDAQVSNEPRQAMPSGTIQQADNDAASSSAATADLDRTPVQAGQQARTSLPGTSTFLPLIGLIGLTSLAGGLSLRFRP